MNGPSITVTIDLAIPREGLGERELEALTQVATRAAVTEAQFWLEQRADRKAARRLARWMQQHGHSLHLAPSGDATSPPEPWMALEDRLLRGLQETPDG